MIDLDKNTENDSESQSGHPRAVFVLGAGFSQAISSLMPCTDQLGERIRESLEIPPNLTRGESFEDWLSRLAEPQPDQSIENNSQRQTYFHAIVKAIVDELDSAEYDLLQKVELLPEWLFRFITVVHFWQSTLVSFNYDTLIERMIPSVSLNMGSASDGSATVPLSAGDIVGQMPPLLNRPSRAPYPSLRLWKLHGSLAWWWAYGDSTGLSITRWPIDGEEMKSSTLMEHTTQFLGMGSRVSIEPAEEIALRKRRLLNDRSRFIAPPSGSKSTYYLNPFMRQLWINASEALQAADEVYFVGYSMPPADSTARGLFRESLKPDTKIIVVNPCPKQICDQINKWGFEVDEVLREPNCVEQMVEMLEDRRGKEALARLRLRFAVGDFDLAANPGAVVMPFGNQSGKQRAKYIGTNGNSLILQESSDEEGALTVPELYNLLTKQARIQDIKLRTTKSDERIIHYEFGYHPDGAVAKMLLTLSLRVATVPNRSEITH